MATVKTRGLFALWLTLGLVLAASAVTLFGGMFSTVVSAHDRARTTATSSDATGDAVAINNTDDGEIVRSSLNALFATLNEVDGRVRDESVIERSTDVIARAGSYFSHSGGTGTARAVSAELDNARSAVLAENALWKADVDNVYVGHVDYEVNVTGFCDESDCAQRAVDRNGFAFISWGSDFSQIAGSIDGPGKVVASFRNGDIVRVTGSGEGVYQVDRILNVPVSTEASSVDPGFAFQTTTKDGIRLAYAHRID